ncbi:MAG: MFS transporter [Candidatus Micrarchaeota archaeon]|nr:MFS transporter [Candidatus Micrarchaeota archaeon]
MRQSQKEKEGVRNITLLGIVSFLNDFSSEMIMPILPFFLASLGGDSVLIGLVGGIRDSITSFLKILFGYLSDKIGKRKVFVYAGYITSAVFKFLLAFAPTQLFALAAASLERVGKGMRDAPRDAMISQFLPHKSGAGFGLHQALDTVGAIFGSVAVLLLLMYVFSPLTPDGYMQIIAFAGVIALLSVVPLIFVKEPKFKPTGKYYNFISAIRALPRDMLIFIGITAVFTIANFSYMFFIMKAGLTEGILIPIMLYIAYNIFQAAFAYPIGKYADRIGKRTVLILSYIVFSAILFGFALLTSVEAMLLLFVLYGIATAAFIGVQKAYAADLSPPSLRGTAMGTFQMAVGIAALPASVIAGYLWKFISPDATFIFGGTVALLAAVLMVVFRPAKLSSG